MVEYKDQFTLDGRLKPANHLVTRAKVQEADRLLQRAMRGDKIANGMLAEAFSSTDLPFQVAHLISSVVVPQFDGAERTWSQLAGVRVVNDFSPVRLASMFSDVSGSGVNADGGLNTVPELAPYPHVTVSGEEAFYSKLQKSGARFSYSWESQINDIAGFLEQIPNELIQLALDTEEREVHEALVNGTTQVLAGGTLPDGTVVPTNALVGPEAIWQAIIELQNVEVNGKKVGRASGYNVVVARGTADFLNWKMNQQILQVQDGLVTYAPGDRSALANVTVVESDYITGTNWIILPKPGAIRRPVLELLRLRGHEAPELRVEAAAGNYLGGGVVSPFSGSYDNDGISMRVRMVAGGVLWANSYSIKSNGTETA